MVEVEVIYMKNYYRDGEIVSTEKVGVGSGYVKELTKEEVEELVHFEVLGFDDADFADIFYRDPETGRWKYWNSITRDGVWAL